MSIKNIINAILMILIFCSNVNAESLNYLLSSGWRVALKETVSDSFNGCNYDTPIIIDGGYIFMCGDYNYHYAYRPDFLVLKRNSQTKFVIDGEVFVGELFTGYPTITYVKGSFNGCEYDKYIPLENGLFFKCQTYHYHYAYHPKVIIVGRHVTIDGEKYDGTLYR